MDETVENTPALIPLSQAAKRLGVSRPTVYRWAKEGKFSVTLGKDGTKLVDMAELARVFPENVTKTQKQDAVRPAPDSDGMLLIQAALEATRESLRITQEQLVEARQREERLLGIVESQTRLLGRPDEDRAPSAVPAWVAVAVVAAVILLTYIIATK